jgi:hypothetical protein
MVSYLGCGLKILLGLTGSSLPGREAPNSDLGRAIGNMREWQRGDPELEVIWPVGEDGLTVPGEGWTEKELRVRDISCTMPVGPTVPDQRTRCTAVPQQGQEACGL